MVDTISVKHVSGDYSTLQFKSYSEGRTKWQGVGLEVVWNDEEPPEDLYYEALTRTNETGGIVYTTFTPIAGMSNIVRSSCKRAFAYDPRNHCCHHRRRRALHTRATCRDCRELSRTRTGGSRPRCSSLGSGKVFLIDETKLLVDPFECPSHWISVGGVDFGWTHHAAFCECWWDRDLDEFYLVRTVRMREKTPLQHVDVVRSWRLRWSWPHDGRNATLAGAGMPLMDSMPMPA